MPIVEPSPFTPPSEPKKPPAGLIRAFLGAEAEKAFKELEGGERKTVPSAEPPPPEPTEEEKRLIQEQRELRELMKTHVELENIPHWDELSDDLKEQFGFDWVREQEYRAGRPMTDFENPNNTEAEPIAKVFDISDVIRKKQQEDPNHPNYLTTAEVLDAIDEAGYRPATLEELLAFARDHWKPDTDPESLSEEDRLRNLQAPYITCLNSVFSHAAGDRDVPRLFWGGRGRGLRANLLEDDWGADDRFLVLRKVSS